MRLKQHRKPRRVLQVLSLVFLLLLAGCDTKQYDAMYDDTATLAGKSGYMAMAYKTTQKGEVYKASGKLSGARTVWHYSNSQPTQFTIAAALTVQPGGKAKLVLVLPDATLVPILENNGLDAEEQTVQLDYLAEDAGKYVVKLVGAGPAELRLDLKVPIGQCGEPG